MALGRGVLKTSQRRTSTLPISAAAHCHSSPPPDTRRVQLQHHTPDHHVIQGFGTSPSLSTDRQPTVAFPQKSGQLRRSSSFADLSPPSSQSARKAVVAASRLATRNAAPMRTFMAPTVSRRGTCNSSF